MMIHVIPIAARDLGDREDSVLETVHAEIVACERCPRLRSWCCQVAEQKKREFSGWSYWGRPVPGSGDPRARMLVVGLALLPPVVRLPPVYGPAHGH